MKEARALASSGPSWEPVTKRGEGEGPSMDDRARSQPLVLDEADATLDGWDDPVKGRIRWRTLFSRPGTPTYGITCGVADLEPGGWLGLHRHAPPEIYYVIAGTGVVTLNGEETPVRAGSAPRGPNSEETRRRPCLASRRPDPDCRRDRRAACPDRPGYRRDHPKNPALDEGGNDAPGRLPPCR